MQVQLGHGAHSRCGGVQDGDEHQCPASRRTSVSNFGYGEEANDHVGQASGTDHQRHGVHEHVEHATGRSGGVLAEAQVGDHLVQLGQQGSVAKVATQTQLGQGVASEVQRNEDRGNRVSKNQHDVLGNLGIGNTFHATEHGVEEHDRLADINTGVAGHVQEAREGNAHARHLTNDVGQ